MKLPPPTHLQKRFRSPNPGANLRRRYEDDSTDLIYSTVPSISGKQTHAHIFCGRTTKMEPPLASLLIMPLCTADGVSPDIFATRGLHYGRQKPNTNIKTTLRTVTNWSNSTPIKLWIVVDVPPTYGSTLCVTSFSASTTPLTLTCAIVQRHRTPLLLVWFLTSVPSLRSISISLSIFISTPPTRPIPSPPHQTTWSMVRDL
jgi:hypothetical protein